MHDRPRRLVAAGMTGIFLASLLAVPAIAASPHPAQVRKAEPRRVVEYRPNRRFTPDTDLVSTSGYAAWMIDELLHQTTPLPPLGSAFMRAERDTGINARYLVAHAILETGWGTSWIALQKHNLFGYGAFDRDPARYALWFPTFAAGISFVANEIRAAYLSPDGRWWRGFPTLRGVNRFYASDPSWADKIVVLANAIDQVVLTLRERGLQFGPPRLTTPASDAVVAAGSSVDIEVPWTSRTLGLPAAIRFAVRWTPLALAEGNDTIPAEAPASPWTLVSRTTAAGQSVDLSVAAPAVPGSWQLEIEARDSDGSQLPVTDSRPIRSIAVRVAAQTEATISIGLDVAPPTFAADRAPAIAADRVSTTTFAAAPAPEPQAGALVASIRNVGRATIPATAPDGTPTLVEAWSLPISAGGDVVRLASAPLEADLPPGGLATIQVPLPAGPAVVVIRLAGDSAAIGRSVPTAVLYSLPATGRAILAQLSVPDLRDDGLVPSAPIAASAPVAGTPVPPSPGVAGPSIRPPDAAGAVPIGLLADPAPRALDLAAQPVLPPWILVRTISTLPSAPVDPTTAFVPWPGDPTPASLQTLTVPGVPAGVRLVVVALVPAGGTDADPATLRLAWVPVAGPRVGPTPR